VGLPILAVPPAGKKTIRVALAYMPSLITMSMDSIIDVRGRNRRMHRRTLAVTLALFSPVLCSNGKTRVEAVERELAFLAGTWEVVAYEVAGTRKEIPAGRRERLTFQGNTFYEMREYEGAPVRGRIILDPSREPLAIDITDAVGLDEERTFQAIYELRGDELRLCLTGGSGRPRPTAFTTGRDINQAIIVYRRVKPKQ
jgi:uncharacterized protein (TIGR03067 family)